MCVELKIKIEGDGVTITPVIGGSASPPTDVASHNQIPDKFPGTPVSTPRAGGDGDSGVDEDPAPGGDGDSGVDEDPGPGGEGGAGRVIVVGPIVINGCCSSSKTKSGVKEDPKPAATGARAVVGEPASGGDGESGVNEDPGPGGSGAGRIIVVGPIVINVSASPRKVAEKPKAPKVP